MSRIIDFDSNPMISISKKVRYDLLHGKAECISDGKLHFNKMTIEQGEIAFWFNKEKVASFATPKGIKYSDGETLAINFASSMPIEIKDAV